MYIALRVLAYQFWAFTKKVKTNNTSNPEIVWQFLDPTPERQKNGACGCFKKVTSSHYDPLSQ
jgi:hypothetical protein